MAEISREHGKGSLIRFGDEPLEVPDTFSTGSIRLDEALGIGGYPRGRVIEAYGPESSGKTTLALHAVASAQKAGMRAAFIDAEHALDPVWAGALGVDMDNLYLSQPDNGEQALQITAKLAKSGLYGIVAIDSVSALTPKSEIEGEIGDSHVGLQARMMSQGLRMMVGAASTTATTIFFINQLREKIGIMFGNPETTSGGKALKFYASIRLDVRGIDTVKDGTEPVGRRCRIKVVKNKLGPPFKQAELDIMFSEGGISRNGELIDMGVERGLIRKAGAWYSYEGDNIGQGKERTREYLRDNPAVADKLEAAIRSARPVTIIAPRGRLTAGTDPAPWDENA